MRTYSIEFSKMELALRMCYLAIALVAIIFFVKVMRGISWNEWTLEQKFSLALAIGLLFYNGTLTVLVYLFVLSVLSSNYTMHHISKL